jgi:hypothetical protein
MIILVHSLLREQHYGCDPAHIYARRITYYASYQAYSIEKFKDDVLFSYMMSEITSSVAPVMPASLFNYK